MSNEHLEDQGALEARARRISKSLADLNARIARLAIFVGASLETEADVQKILNREHPQFQSHPEEGSTVVQGPEEHRTVHAWEELRGLLVLRCDMMAKMLDNLGLDVSEQISSQAEEHLERVGFKPKADGFNLLPRREP